MNRLTQYTTLLLVILLALCLPLRLMAQKPQPSSAEQEATYVGQQACQPCHSDIVERFGWSIHGRLARWEVKTDASGCEACHGPGSKHVEANGDPQWITGFRRRPGREASRPCLVCHEQGKVTEWPGSVHAMAGLGCVDCHRIHQSRRLSSPAARPLAGASVPNPEMGTLSLTRPAPPETGSLVKPEPELCFDCHREKRARFRYNSHHPVIERRMTCTSCHAVHGSRQPSLLATEEGLNDLCTRCHPAQQGPFVFEHAAVEEGCTTCHEPHGSVANNLLLQNEPFLCLQCHEAHFHLGREGISTPVIRPTGGSTNPFGSSGWRRAFATKCTVCHPQVHGSDLPSQAITGQGYGFTR